MSLRTKESARVDIRFHSCQCEICSALIVVYHVRVGTTVWVTDRPENVCALAEFMGGAVVIWTKLMTRRQYQSIPQPACEALN